MSELNDLFKKIVPADWLDSAGVDYRRTHGSSGPQLNVKTCPSCGNSQYKVFLNAETGLGNCFSGSCQETYNMYKFIKSYRGYGSHADVIGDAEKHVRQYQFLSRGKKEKKVAPPNVLYVPRSKPIPYDGKNLKYLSDRGISGEIAAKYQLRHCQFGSFKYTDDSGIESEQIYNDRIIIPIFDGDGKLASFQGRDITESSRKKYLFPPGFASTGALLYNMIDAMGKPDVVLNEGVFDVIAAQIALPEVGVVGSFGMHLTVRQGEDDQYTQLKRMEVAGMDRLTIMWDGSLKATKTAITQGIDLVRNGMLVRIAMLPKDKDPNEVSAEVVRECFDNAMTLTRLSAPLIMATAVNKYGRD